MAAPRMPYSLSLPPHLLRFYLRGPGGGLRGSLRVLVRGRCLPARLLQWELDGDALAVLTQDVRAGLDSSVVEEGC